MYCDLFFMSEARLQQEKERISAEIDRLAKIESPDGLTIETMEGLECRLHHVKNAIREKSK